MILTEVIDSNNVLIPSGNEYYILSFFKAGEFIDVFFSSVGDHDPLTMTFCISEQRWATRLWTVRPAEEVIRAIMRSLAVVDILDHPIEMVYQYGGSLLGREIMIKPFEILH
jgi:hypothetical protein